MGSSSTSLQRKRYTGNGSAVLRQFELGVKPKLVMIVSDNAEAVAYLTDGRGKLATGAQIVGEFRMVNDPVTGFLGIEIESSAVGVNVDAIGYEMHVLK